MSDLLASLPDNPLVSAAGSALLIALVGLWLAGAWWAYRDAARRTESSPAAFVAAGWIVLSTPLLLPLALAIYALVRPSTTAAEHRSHALAAALNFKAVADASCATCGAATEPDWRRCPQCATWLTAACAGCGEWAPAGLELCPFCGREADDALDTDDVPVRAPDAPTAVHGGKRASSGQAASQLVASSRSQA